MSLMQRRDVHASKSNHQRIFIRGPHTLDAGLIVVPGDCPMALLISCKSE
jgi:hypothetical protein